VNWFAKKNVGILDDIPADISNVKIGLIWWWGWREFFVWLFFLLRI